VRAPFSSRGLRFFAWRPSLHRTLHPSDKEKTTLPLPFVGFSAVAASNLVPPSPPTKLVRSPFCGTRKMFSPHRRPLSWYRLRWRFLFSCGTYRGQECANQGPETTNSFLSCQGTRVSTAFPPYSLVQLHDPGLGVHEILPPFPGSCNVSRSVREKSRFFPA